VWGEQVKGSNQVTVNFGAPQAAVKVYDPTVGVEAVETLSNADAVPLELSDHPCIVEIASFKR
jgi:hypothetical protein